MELKVSKRQAGKAKDLLLEGKVPGIVYGKHIEEAIMVQFDKNEFLKLYKKSGSNTVITLKWDGIEQMVLIYDLQLDPVKDSLMHVDFLAVKKWEKVKAEIPVIIEWEEVLQKVWLKANLITTNIEVESIPSKLPHNIKIDVSKMEDGENIHIEDLNIWNDVEIINDKEDVILVIYNPEENAAKQDKKDAAKEEEIEKAQEEEDKETESKETENNK